MDIRWAHGVKPVFDPYEWYGTLQEEIRELARTPRTPTIYLEAPMAEVQYHTAQGGPIARPVLSDRPGLTMSQILTDANRYFFNAQGRPKTPEDKFRDLDVREGDRIRLTTRRAPDASQLEGDVLGVKVRNGKSEVRIKGFGHTGGRAGGQHVWFPVEDYTIEVLHRSFRWSKDDEILVEVGGFPRSEWEKWTEDRRQRQRDYYAPRVERIKTALGVAQ